MEMKLTRSQVSILNATAQSDFQKAQNMLDGMNLVLGTSYGWLAKRVVWFDEPEGSTAEKYAGTHDALAYTN